MFKNICKKADKTQQTAHLWYNKVYYLSYNLLFLQFNIVFLIHQTFQNIHWIQLSLFYCLLYTLDSKERLIPSWHTQNLWNRKYSILIIFVVRFLKNFFLNNVEIKNKLRSHPHILLWQVVSLYNSQISLQYFLCGL